MRRGCLSVENANGSLLEASLTTFRDQVSQNYSSGTPLSVSADVKYSIVVGGNEVPHHTVIVWRTPLPGHRKDTVADPSCPSPPPIYWPLPAFCPPWPPVLLPWRRPRRRAPRWPPRRTCILRTGRRSGKTASTCSRCRSRTWASSGWRVWPFRTVSIGPLLMSRCVVVLPHW